MSFDWLEYLQLAEELLAKSTILPNDESKIRSAVSRAYYAAFNQAKLFLETKDRLTIPHYNVHQYVIYQLKNSSDTRRKKIGNRLFVLRDYRNQADYNQNIVFTINTCEESLTLARRIIQVLNTL